MLTREVKVHSYGVFDFSTGARLKHRYFELEAGYNIWGHPNERIEFFEPLIFNEGIAGSTPCTTASNSTINNQAQDDTEFVTLCESDLDIHSAEGASALNHIFFFGGGAHHLEECFECFIGLGFFTEWPQKNRPLPSVGGWAKIGISF